MRDTQSENIHSDVHAEKHESTKQIATLGHCLLESDAETMRLARRNRRKSLALSTLIEAALLTAAIVVPLFASHALPLVLNDPPIPVPRGIMLAPTPPGGDPGPTPHPLLPPKPDGFFPISIPANIPLVNDRESGTGQPDTAAGHGPYGVPGGVSGLDPNVFNNLPRGARPAAPDEPESRPRGLAKISEGVQAARLIHRVEPVYPPLMRQIRKSGRVVLRAIIGKDGTVRELEVVSADPGFIFSAQAAVLQWRYQPTLLNGEPVEVETRITVIYTMSSN